MREAGASVPPELLPEVSAGIRVVRVDADGLVEPPGELAPGLNVMPVGAAETAGHGGRWPGRRLPGPPPAAADDLLLGGRGPGARPGRLAAADHVQRHRRHPRGAVAGRDRGRVVLATQGDGRLQRALHWTEGFGGRECPYLADHHGDGDLARRARRRPGGAGGGRVDRAGDDPRGTHRRGSPPTTARRPGAGRGAPPRAALPGAGRRRGLPAVLGRPAPALAGQPVHLRRRAVAGGLLPLRLGRQRVRLLGGHRPRRELHRLPVVEHPEDRRPAARAGALRAALRLRVDLGRLRPPERDLRRRGPRRPDLLRVRRGLHDAGRALARAGRTPRVPGGHDPAPPRLGHGAQRLGLPRPAVQPAGRGVPGVPWQLRVAGLLPAVLRRHRRPAPS